MQVGSGRPLGNPEHLADFGVLISLDIMQDDHGPLTFPEGVERARQARAQFIGFRRIAMRGR
jgi:hypothetical protein